jgi:ribosome-binding factor A
MSRRTERAGNLIRNTIGRLLLSKISDPRIEPAKTSITRVDIPEDLLTAKVYVSVIGTDAEQKLALRALSHAAGHIQELMMREISLRHTPTLEFVLDTNFKKTLETYVIIEQAMQEIRQKEDALQDEATDRGADNAPETQ